MYSPLAENKGKIFQTLKISNYQFFFKSDKTFKSEKTILQRTFKTLPTFNHQIFMNYINADNFINNFSISLTILIIIKNQHQLQVLMIIFSGYFEYYREASLTIRLLRGYEQKQA